MGHVRRMQHNRRRQIHEMIKERENERTRDDIDERILDVREHERVLEGKGKIPRD